LNLQLLAAGCRLPGAGCPVLVKKQLATSNKKQATAWNQIPTLLKV
jgi:hypothetical protein